jgi:glycosyltransferase involved in cell wall biosynthesis
MVSGIPRASAPPHAAATYPIAVAFIGSAGIPNRYGGFEAFLEHCAPTLAERTQAVLVTCDKFLYSHEEKYFRGVIRQFIPIRANGAWSILHDLVAFLAVFPRANVVVVLGVSGGIWFPLFRLLCDAAGKKLIVNVDGLEWRREKHRAIARFLLRGLDWVAQKFAHKVIYDNAALESYLSKSARSKSREIAYSGDHVMRFPSASRIADSALTVCRIEPENNIEMLIQGAIASSLALYTIVGNWDASRYGQDLKAKYGANRRLRLMRPVYDLEILGKMRETCSVYLHGHSVGGTNPSLVEMLFYDCQIICHDNKFNRATAGHGARYFSDLQSLIAQIEDASSAVASRSASRSRYTRQAIVESYLQEFVD